MDFEDILLWLFVINLGIVFGAGLYEAKVVVPLWASSPPESLRSPDSGRKFWAFVTTIPLTLLTLASLVAAWHAQGPQREWWLVAAIVILVERISTFSYFIPTMLQLQRAAMPQAEVKARVTQCGGAATKTFTTEFTEKYRGSERFGVNLVSWNNGNLRETSRLCGEDFLAQRARRWGSVGQWARLNYLRSALTLVAWLGAMKALTLPT